MIRLTWRISLNLFTSHMLTSCRLSLCIALSPSFRSRHALLKSTTHGLLAFWTPWRLYGALHHVELRLWNIGFNSAAVFAIFGMFEALRVFRWCSDHRGSGRIFPAIAQRRCQINSTKRIKEPPSKYPDASHKR